MNEPVATEPQARSSINLRVEPRTRALIDEAAAALGKTRTEFMIESARRSALDVLLEQRIFGLDPGGWDAFVAVLDAPPPPRPKLAALLARKAPWRS